MQYSLYTSPLGTGDLPGKPKRARSQGEHLIQKDFFRWVDAFKEFYYPLACTFAVPNGGLRNIKVAMKLKAEGVRPGVCDVICIHPFSDEGKVYAGLVIEFKYGENTQSDDQMEWEKRFVYCGFKYCVFYNSADAKKEFNRCYGLGIINL